MGLDWGFEFSWFSVMEWLIAVIYRDIITVTLAKNRIVPFSMAVWESGNGLTEAGVLSSSSLSSLFHTMNPEPSGPVVCALTTQLSSLHGEPELLT